jgi:hypothetical protein
MNHPVSHPVFALVGFAAWALSFYFTQREFNNWRAQTGYAPPPGTNRVINREYNHRIWQVLPREVRIRVRVIQVAGAAMMLTCLFLAA